MPVGCLPVRVSTQIRPSGFACTSITCGSANNTSTSGPASSQRLRLICSRSACVIMVFPFPKHPCFPLLKLLRVHRNLRKRRNHGLGDLDFLYDSVHGLTHF